MESTQEYFMRMALRLARKGVGPPAARALAGAVVVARGGAVGFGQATDASSQPAVLMALEEAGPLALGATLYTNIEPCLECDQSESYLARLLALRPDRVVIGHRSSITNGVASRVIAALELAGTVVETGLCEAECRETNEVFYKYLRTKMPFVTVKFAASLDGRIATSTGDSQWISSPLSLRFAHQLRREHDAVLVGIGTVLADDPQLNVRLVSGNNPIRVVVDTSLRIPDSARVFSNLDSQRTIIVTTDRADLSRASRLQKLGVEVWVMPSSPPAPAIVSAASPKPESASSSPERHAVNLTSLLATLGENRFASVLVEGGPGIITSLLANRSVDRLVAIIAPKIIGQGVEAIGDLGIERLRDAITFSSIKTRRLGSDIIFDGRLQPIDHDR